MIVFTVITGGYDRLKPIRYRNPEWQYIAIVDDMSMDSNGWELIHADTVCQLGGNRQRRVKILSAIQFFQEDTIYIDGSHELTRDITSLYTGQFTLKKHPVRNCLYQEAAACIRLKKASPDEVARQIEGYRKLGMPSNYGMYETGVLMRPYTPEVIDFCSRWWQEVDQYTHRDQLSITKVLWETGIKVKTLGAQTISRYIKIHPHERNILHTDLRP